MAFVTRDVRVDGRDPDVKFVSMCIDNACLLCLTIVQSYEDVYITDECIKFRNVFYATAIIYSMRSISVQHIQLRVIFFYKVPSGKPRPASQLAAILV